jgi:hypothetical protein
MEYDLVKRLEVTPGMDAAEQRRRIDSFVENEARQAGRFWSLLEQEIERDRPRLRSISYQPNVSTPSGGLEDVILMKWSADLKISKGPTLLIDADLDVAIARRFLPDLEVVTIQARRRSYHATQISDRRVSKSMLMYDLLGGTAADECQRAANRRGDLRALLEVQARSAAEIGDGESVLCISYKGVVETIASEGDIPGVEYGHFNAIRGKDRWKEVDVIVVAGRTQPSVHEIERLADALFFKSDQQIAYIAPDADGRISWPVESRGFRGVAGAAPVEYHPDPVCAALLSQIREAELIQAIDRARLVHRAPDRPCKVLVLTNVVLPLTVHQLSTWEALIPDRFTRAAWRGPAVPASYGELARVFPDLWPSAGAVEQDYRRSRSTPYESLIELLLGKRRGLKRVEYRLPQQTGLWTPALVAAAADPRAALESVVGPVAAFRLVGGADPKPERIFKMHDVLRASGRTSSPVCATLVVCQPVARGRLFAIDLPFDLPRQPTAPARGAQLQVVPTVTPAPPSDDARPAAEEPAPARLAIGVPPAWIEGGARLLSLPCPSFWPHRRWLVLQEDVRQFLQQWAARAAALDWSALELFGVSRNEPFARIDLLGVLPLIGGRRITELEHDFIAWVGATGSRQVYKRIGRGDDRPYERIMLWDVASVALLAEPDRVAAAAGKGGGGQCATRRSDLR